MENERHGLVAVAAQLLFDELLRVVQNHRLQANIARGIDAVHVAESRRNSEPAVGHGGQRLVDLPHLLWLGVQPGGIHIGVVHTILLTASDAQLHLQEEVDLGHALQVLLADGDVLLKGLLRQIQHVRREQRLAVLLKVLLVGLHESIEPGQPGLLAVISVEDHRNAVELGDLAHMEGTSHSAGDAGSIISVVRGLTCNELATTTGEGDHDGSTSLLGCLHASIHRAAAHHVDSWNGELVLLGIVQQVHQSLASDNARLHGRWHLGESLLSHRSGLPDNLAFTLGALARGSGSSSDTSHSQGQAGR
mmetsp:Transcript_15328/g.28928  ORF Transcript_15328/g.28928 Transcript_15328/m.28928 type:complete len:306 (+) Transcript_15328:496-1413(+)